MVNTGYGLVKCLECKKGCWEKTAVNRNKQFEPSVISNRCDHFNISISIHTMSNYVAWVIGPRDRISFYLNAQCLNCNKAINHEVTKEGFDIGAGTLKQKCPRCDNTVIFEYESSQSLFDDIILSLLPYGNLLKGLAHRIDNYLEVKQFQE